MTLASVVLLVVIASNWISVETGNSQRSTRRLPSGSSPKKDVKTMPKPKNKTGPTVRLQKGYSVNKETYPFVLAISGSAPGSPVICTAALIQATDITVLSVIQDNQENTSSVFALTAAHCVCHFDNKTRYIYPKSTADYEFTAGDTYSEDVIIRRPIVIYCNPDYNPDHFANDLALIVLDQPIKYSQSVSAIHLVDPKSRDVPQNCKYASRGLIANIDKPGSWGRYHAQAQVADLKRTSDCSARLLAWDRDYPPKLFPQHLCFDVSPAYACEGDSGSPIFCYFPNDDRPYMVAVASHAFGPDPSRCGTSTMIAGPKLDTATNYRWIQDQIRSYYGFYETRKAKAKKQ